MRCKYNNSMYSTNVDDKENYESYSDYLYSEYQLRQEIYTDFYYNEYENHQDYQDEYEEYLENLINSDDNPYNIEVGVV